MGHPAAVCGDFMIDYDDWRNESTNAADRPGRDQSPRDFAAAAAAAFRRRLAKELTTSGARYYYRRNYEKALGVLDAAVRLDPGYWLAYYWRGIVWYWIEEHDRALVEYDEAVRLAPQEATVYSHRARVWVALQELDRAIADFKESARLDPAYPSVHRELADARSAVGDFAKAVEDYGEAIRRNPRDAWAYQNRSVARCALKDYDGALADIDETARLPERSASTYCCRGDAWRGMRRYDEALADYDLAVVEYPADHPVDWAEPFLGKATIRLILGQPEVVDDARAAIEAEGWQGGGAVIVAALIGCLGARRAGMADEGRRFLDDAAANADASSWPFPVVRFLRGEIDGVALLDLAPGSRERASALCWIAYNQLLNGRVEHAQDTFRQASNLGALGSLEVVLADAELHRFGLS